MLDVKAAATAVAGRADCGQTRPRVAILMGTFYGERFLARQLDSIGMQTRSDWTLWVSDDRSGDGTLAVLDAYCAKWGAHKLRMRTGPARGFTANFLALACDPAIEADFFSFADQDDLWDADKLAVAIRWLEAIPAGVPALYCARTRLIDETDGTIGLSPLFPKPPVFANAIVQSVAGGNTMVFNAAARALLVEAGADVVVQTHDWWVYILVTACGGRVFYDATPRVGYRQHDRNLVGSNASWVGRLRRAHRILKGQFKTMNDRNIAALQSVRHRLSPQALSLLHDFSHARAAGLVPRVLGIWRSGVYCQTLLSNLALAGASLLKKL
ncbi:MAG: glycosyltransferase family 2 protein [Burkholderiales bacterium]